MKTVSVLFAEAAERTGVALGKPEYLASPTGDYYAASTPDGRWLRVDADLFELELDSTIERSLDAAITGDSSRHWDQP